MNTELFKSKSITKHGSKYDYSLSVYTTADKKVIIICPIHGKFEQNPYAHFGGSDCLECSKKKRGAARTKLAKERFEKDARNVHGDRYDYSLVEYKKSSKKVDIICKIHGAFHQTPNSHLSGQGCYDCGVIKCHINSSLSTEEFIEKSRIIHKDKYIYDLVNYTVYDEPVKIICRMHGVFEQTPHGHLNGRGCKKCGIESTIKNNTKTNEQFAQLGSIIHNNKYDYSLVNYINCKLYVDIICPIHGKFEQTPDNHIQGYGCGRCGKTALLNTELFIKMSNIVHKDRYLYNPTKYTKSRKKVIITCKNHGPFEQYPNAHLGGSGCTKCTHVISLAEISWLDYLKIPLEYRQVRIPVKVGSRNYIKTDAYDPNTNTIYEFNGDFWHGNPAKYKPNDMNKIVKKTFGELHKETIFKKNAIINAGYNLISIWESDWNKKRKEIVK